MLRGGNSPPSIEGSDTESEIESEIEGSQKNNQILYINKLISLARAFSIHYYRRARFWKYVYWVFSSASFGLAGLATVINAFFNNCSEDPTVRNINVTMNSVIMAMISGITFLNPSLRSKCDEEAGDKYNSASNNLYVEVFCSDSLPENHDLKMIIDKYVMHFDELSDRYTEPSLASINKILDSDDYEFLVRIHRNDV